MSKFAEPRVSILTPVFNGESFLRECIESVLSQTYSNWDYTIVNNCSTDRSLAIATEYARRDERIRIKNNSRFLGIVQNHNHTIRQISSEAKYCKFVYADDWLYPDCIAQMVALAEEFPTIGLVSAYTMDGSSIRWCGPPYPCRRISGREICRQELLGGPYVFGTMTSVLLRSDLVREMDPFFNEKHLQADMETFFDILQRADFGFIHQVLSFGRETKGTTDGLASNLNSQRLGEFLIFLKYAAALLTPDELNEHWPKAKKKYYRELAHNCLRLRGKEFWQYHRTNLSCYNIGIDPILLLWSLLMEVGALWLHPIETLSHAMRWWNPKIRNGDEAKIKNFRIHNA